MTTAGLAIDPEAFCPGPFVGHWRFSPCIIALVPSLFLFFYIFLAASAWAVWLFRARTDAKADRGSSSEQQGLLNADGSPAGDGVEEGEATTTPPTPVQVLSLANIARVLSAVIFFTSLVDIVLDYYHSLHSDIPSTMPMIGAVELARIFDSFAWIIAGAAVMVHHTSKYAKDFDPLEAKRSCPLFISWFWQWALFLGVLQLTQYLLDIIVPAPDYGHPTFQTAFDQVFLGLFLVRLVSIVVLSVLSARENKSIQARDGDSVDRRDDDLNKSTWSDFFSKMKTLAPYIWPSHSIVLQSLIFACVLLLVIGRIVNLLIPWQFKNVLDALTPGSPAEAEDKRPYFAWAAILAFVLLRSLQGGMGVLSMIQYFLWVHVGQYTTRHLSVSMLGHLHHLSLQFHLNRKTGEVLRVMDRGVSSIGSLLSYILFNITPVIFDIVLTSIAIALQFDLILGTTLAITMILYIACTIVITEWRTKFRREMIETDNAARARAVDSLLNFETVKYYNNEAWEVARFDEAVEASQRADYKSQSSMYILNGTQNVIISVGLLVCLLICAKRIVDGSAVVSDFVMLFQYITQVYLPLNWFGTYYRAIQQNFVDMEKMLDLFKENQGVEDSADAHDLVMNDGGTIVFDNVEFSYDPKQTSLKGISFEVPKGKRIALVGDSGGGKSTIFRLLFRFYDIQSGKITVDGQDIRDLTQKSLRRHIGVVPQDTVLFNNTVRYNIRYGNVNATDEEVEAAAKAAQIHDRIMQWPDGYETKVGERGLRLSGGEKQRVAIARTLLKNPSIILLDEATSALDSTTEQLIQRSLSTLCADRTTLVIAHRLTTIVDADLILVLKDGRIVERGTHDELLKSGEEISKMREAKILPAGVEGGVYYNMWMRQLDEENAAAESVTVRPPPRPSSTRKSVATSGSAYGDHGHGHGSRHG